MLLERNFPTPLPLNDVWLCYWLSHSLYICLTVELVIICLSVCLFCQCLCTLLTSDSTWAGSLSALTSMYAAPDLSPWHFRGGRYMLISWMKHATYLRELHFERWRWTMSQINMTSRFSLIRTYAVYPTGVGKDPFTTGCEHDGDTACSEPFLCLPRLPPHVGEEKARRSIQYFKCLRKGLPHVPVGNICGLSLQAHKNENK